MTDLTRFSRALFVAAFLSLFPRAIAHADAPRLAQLFSADGAVEYHAAAEPTWRSIVVGAPFFERDAVRTGMRSRAALRFEEGYLVRLGDRTTLTVLALDKDRRTLELTAGQGYFLSCKTTALPTVQTPQVSATVRGTEFAVDVTSGRTVLTYDDFWVASAGVGYQLPYRHGFVQLSVNNLFDQDFIYERTRGEEDRILPERSVVLTESIKF